MKTHEVPFGKFLCCWSGICEDFEITGEEKSIHVRIFRDSNPNPSVSTNVEYDPVKNILSFRKTGKNGSYSVYVIYWNNPRPVMHLTDYSVKGKAFNKEWGWFNRLF
jgi:hypothetical protein